MTTIDDGGPAFPFPDTVRPDGNVQHGWIGMSLRDWFASQALAGIISGVDAKSEGSQAIKPIAAAAYDFADAMLAAREVKP